MCRFKSKVGISLLAALLALLMFGSCLAENTEAPRSYFPYPAELEGLPEQSSLPDLFTFFDASADPDGSGYVETPDQWPARQAELKDMLQYYVYGSRLDPLKSDTVVTAVRENFQFVWAEGVMAGPGSMFGYNALPVLPEGAVTYQSLDFSAWGMGIFYSNIAPNEVYVHEGDDFDMPGDLADWKAGDTWAEHADAVQRETLPTVTVEICIKDTNPANDAYRSEAAANEGVKLTFNIRFPAEAPVVDGKVRDEKASRHGAGYPVLVGIGSVSEAQIKTLNNNGYVFMSVSDTADPDNGQLSAYEKVYPPTDPVVYNDNTIVNEYMKDSGDLMHSAWAASRALDAIENYMLLSQEEKVALGPVFLPDIDVYSSAVIGCSHAGKRAIVTGIFDTGDNGNTRFDIITASDPCSAGTVGFRYQTEGQLFSYEAPKDRGVVHDYPYGVNETLHRAIQNTGEDQWFADRAQIFTVRPDLYDNAPFDIHALIALFASSEEERYFLSWSPEGGDAWGNSPASVLNIQAARELYEFLGQGDNIAVVVRDQSHATQDRDIADLIAIMDKVYYGEEKLIRKYHATLAGADGLTAADGNGTILPDIEYPSVRAMERYPYYVPSFYTQWSRPTKHTLWTSADSVTEGVPVTFDFHTDAEKVELTLTDGAVLSAEAVDGIAYISLTAEQAKAGQYVATAVGAKDSKSIEICGWTISDALRHGVTDNSALGHDVGSGIAFTTPLVNYNDPDDPVRLYMDGKLLAADIYDYDNKVIVDGETVPQSGYLQPYGATLILYEGTEGYNLPMGEKTVFSIRNAKIAALQGYVLALDIELEKYSPSGNRMRFKTTYNTLNTQTPTWEPELLQNTPKSGLMQGETVWPFLGNWTTDYDENGNLKPIEEIRPAYSAKTEALYKVEMSVKEADVNGFTIAFSAPVNPHDFALAINTVKGVEFHWAEDAQSVYVSFDEPAAAGSQISVYVFRSVDSEGNMISGPVALQFGV